MVRLSQAQPFLEAAREVNANIEDLLEPYGVATTDFEDPGRFVSAPSMYDIVETLASATGDPFCGASLGSARPLSYLLYGEHEPKAHSLGDLLLHFCINVRQQVNSVVFILETTGDRSSFSSQRSSDGGRSPRHVDAYGAASFIATLRIVLAENWKGNQVMARVCDPTVMPRNFWGVRIAQGNSRGLSITFPSNWLLLDAQAESWNTPLQPGAADTRAPADTLHALHYLLSAHLHEPNLGADRIARLWGVSKRTLARRLAEQGTSLKNEVDRMRQSHAESALLSDAQSIAQVGAKLGYNDPSVFTRAFKRWTGMTPRQYRAHHTQ